MKNSLVKSDFALHNPITGLTVKDCTAGYPAEGRAVVEDYLVIFSFRHRKKYSEQLPFLNG